MGPGTGVYVINFSKAFRQDISAPQLLSSTNGHMKGKENSIVVVDSITFPSVEKCPVSVPCNSATVGSGERLLNVVSSFGYIKAILFCKNAFLLNS